MLQKAKSIALHTVRYGDSSLVAYLYSQDFGRISLMVNGAYGKGKLGRKSIYFQPLNIVDVVFYPAKSHGMGRLKEVSVASTSSSIHLHPVKSVIAIFLGEIIYRAIREEESNPSLFQFIEASILSLDALEQGIANFHLLFLAQLSKYLGFFPSGEYSTSTPFFDYKNGLFVKHQPVHPLYFSKDISQILSQCLRTSYANCGDIVLLGKQRSHFLERMLAFYTFHMESVHGVKSLSILSEVFAD